MVDPLPARVLQDGQQVKAPSSLIHTALQGSALHCTELYSNELYCTALL